MKKFMKKLVSLAVVLGVCLGFTTAMASGQGDWSGSFRLTNGKVVTHTPTTVSYGNISSTTGIDLSQFIGFKILSHLCSTIVQPNQSRPLFLAVLICNGLISPVTPITPTTP